MIRVCENTKKPATSASTLLTHKFCIKEKVNASLLEYLPPLKFPRHLHKKIKFIPDDVQVLVELDPVGQEDPAVPPA